MENSKRSFFDSSFRYKKVIVRVFFTCLIFYLYSNIIIEFIPSLDKTIKALRFVADILIILVSFYSFRVESNRAIQLFIGVYLSLSMFTFAINANEVSLSTHFNGLREPLVFLCTLAFYNYLFNAENFLPLIKRFNKFLLFFAVTQIPFALNQFVIYGAGDFVGGTFSKGGSGILTISLSILVFYFLLNYSSDLHFNKIKATRMIWLFVLLIPVFINETKISVFILTAMFALLVINKGQIFLTIISSITGIIILVLFAYVYDGVSQGQDQVGGENKLTQFFSYDFIYEYTFAGDQNYFSENDIPRFYKMVLLYEVVYKDPLVVLFGKGYGVFKGQNFLGVNNDAQIKYWHIYRGSKTMITTAILQGGVFLLVILLIAIFYFLFKDIRSSRHFNFLRFRIFLIFIFIVLVVYNDSIFVNYISVFYSYFIMFAFNEEKILQAMMNNN